MKDPETLPELYREQELLGELPDDPAIRERLAANPAGSAQRTALEASDREILERYPAELMTRRIENRLAQKRAPAAGPTVWRLAWMSLPSAALLLVVLWLFEVQPPVEGPNSVPGGSPEIVRIKGETRLVINRQRGETAEVLVDGSWVADGDVLQLSYFSESATHGVILSVDGRGKVSLHFPDSPSGSTQIAVRKLVRLNFAYELDDAPDFERFYFVASAAPLDPARLIQAAERLGKSRCTALELGSGDEQVQVLLRKRAGR